MQMVQQEYILILVGVDTNVPSEAKWMFIVSRYNDIDINYKYIFIGNKTYVQDSNKQILTITDIGESINNKLKQNIKTMWVSGAVSVQVGGKATQFGNVARRNTFIYDKKPYDLYILPSEVFNVRLTLFDDDLVCTSYSNYTDDFLTIPKNTYYRLSISLKDDSASMLSLTDDYINTNLDIVSKDYYNWISSNSKLKVKWMALGDSITQGYYSFWKDGVAKSGVSREKCWVNLVSINNEWELTNNGWGGQGYLDLAGETRGYEYIDTLDFSDYNLVTLAYGINDWKGNQVVGSYTDNVEETQTTVCGAMKHCIEKIMSSNPNCKIIVILPFNCIGYEYNYGDKSTNYALGYDFPKSGTLETFVQKMIEVCNYYGIEYIDETHYSCINRENLRDLLPDGVHPSIDCHELIAHELSKKIAFN